MTGNVEERIAQLSEEYLERGIPEEVRKGIRLRILDSVGVALGSRGSPAVEAGIRIAERYPGEVRSLAGVRTTPDMAGFLNTLMIRYLDFNDTYLSKEPLHPSDMIGGVLAMTSLAGDIGRVEEAIALGYQVSMEMCDSASLRSRGFDHVNYLMVGEVTALSHLLGLDREKFYSALGMAIVPNIALRETRVGSLSMWKAGAAADVSRNAIFAVISAMEGFTGPSTPISGGMGMGRTVLGGEKFNEVAQSYNPHRAVSSYIKLYPVEYHAQLAVDLALRISERVDWRRIVKVRVETYEAGVSILADREKWEPQNRETADHSLPFAVASAIVRGDFWLDIYDRIGDQDVRDLMSKVEVRERADYTSQYPENLPTAIEVELSDGSRIREEDSVPRGHVRRPATQEEVLKKFLRITGDRDLAGSLVRKGVEVLV